jgi:hypothetical protein
VNGFLAVFFVATVGAVGRTGTMEESGNARVVPTTELVGPTSGVVAPVRRFVRSVCAVYAAVAYPRLYDAVAVVVALKLGRTALRRSGRFGTTDFISLVGTVEVSVATPVQRYASVVFNAREFGLGTCDVGTVELVRAVLTVVVSVAHPNLLNTLSVAARKLVVSTCFVALLLVGAVRTVGIAVAHPCQRDALAFGLSASELVRVAHSFLAYF